MTKFKKMIVSVVFWFIFSEQINCLKILTVFPTPSKSHWFIGSSIAKTLAEAGHEVTVISCWPIKNPPSNYKDVHLEGLFEMAQKHQDDSEHNPTNIPSTVVMYVLHIIGRMFSEQVLTNPNVHKMLTNKNDNFDLVITELFATPSLIGFGEYFNAPVIGLSTSGSTKWTYEVTGNTAPLSYVPNQFADSTGRMTFKNRLNNALLATFENLISLMYYRSEKQLYEKYFPNAKLPYSEMIKKGVSLVLLNTHFSLNPLAPYLPNTIEIGGIHVEKEIKSLPKDLETFIESAEHGVIYFSLGSNIKSSHFPVKSQQAFAKAFSILKEKVIWKSEKDIENLPENVLVRSWCPQNDILAHPNVKLFISHGGLLSLTETIYHAKPLIGVPYFGDQKVNIAFAEENGFGYKLNSYDLTFESISKSLKTVLNNQSYVENMQRASNIFHDQPMTPKEKLVYWVEYVARHKGAHHLQSAGQELNFIEYHMIDVFGFLCLVVILGLSMCFFCIKFTFRKIFVKKTKIE